MTIKAIETRYNGYRFRSRLEARWAVFFDALGIPWEYEKEGYSLPSGPYLPDFWIPLAGAEWPGSGHWVEVKPAPPSEEEVTKLVELCIVTGHHAYLCHGAVGCGEFTAAKVVCCRSEASLDYWVRAKGRPAFFKTDAGDVVPLARPVMICQLDSHPDRAGVLLEGRKSEDDLDCFISICDLAASAKVQPVPHIGVGFAAARSARFEHGETPRPR